jgi:hypothetical protein
MGGFVLNAGSGIGLHDQDHVARSTSKREALVEAADSAEIQGLMGRVVADTDLSRLESLT